MNAPIGNEDVEIEFVLNGKPLRRQVKVRQHLADFLRQELELTGTHLGCEHGVCGACTVMIDGATARGWRSNAAAGQAAPSPSPCRRSARLKARRCATARLPTP